MSTPKYIRQRTRLLSALVFWALVPDVGAQIILCPGCRTVHLWVDARLGNDAQASSNNPRLITLCPSATANGCQTPVCPGQTKYTPLDEKDPNQSNHELLHAPWPFKTVTAAIAHVNSNFGPLPYTSPITGLKITHVIVHCMPGRYARSTAQDLHTGFYGNGETFPIDVPDGVCIKGTSALNTVFDVEGDVIDPETLQYLSGPVFRFGEVTGSTGTGSFIDKVAITGAPNQFRPAPPALPPDRDDAAAIYIGPNYKSTPTITNCLLFGNGVGITVDANPSWGTDAHKVFVLNNTIAFNRIGIWNGRTDPTVPSSEGTSKLMLVNNVFDAHPATPYRLSCGGPGATRPFPASWRDPALPVSCFEGVVDADCRVVTGPSTTKNFNAHQAHEISVSPPSVLYTYNLGLLTGETFSSLGLRLTLPRAGSTTPAAPGVDLTPYTDYMRDGTNLRRGVLYVRDLMYNGSDAVSSPGSPYLGLPCKSDLAPGDLRLAPAAAQRRGVVGPPPHNLPLDKNPLVDTGYAITPITMANGLILAAPPGALGAENWPFHSWNEDCEGFGNPRIYDHPEYAPITDGPIDIGADELGVLVCAGYRFGTTTFLD